MLSIGHHVDDVGLVAWLDQELSGVQAATVDVHLAGCVRCRTRADELRAAVRNGGDKPLLLLINREGRNLFVTIRPANS